MKLRLSIFLAAAALAAAPAAGQTIKSLGYNTTNGNIVAATNVTFTNSVGFSTNARAATRTNLDLGAAWLTNTSVTNFRTAIGLGATWLTNTNVTNFRTAIGLGTTNNPIFSAITLTEGDELQINGGGIYSVGFNGAMSFEEQRLTQDSQTIFSWETNSFAVTPAATFSTNVSVAGSLTVGSFTTTTPSTWALDATQTAAATNGRLTLPSNANVIRLTNNNAISSVTNGVLGAFYYLVNQATNAVTISNVGGITIDGAQNLALSPNESATLVATGPTNVSVAARGDLTDVALGGTANTAPQQAADSASSLMTRQLSDDRYFNQPNLLHININNFTGATVGGNSSGRNIGLLTAAGQTVSATITNSFMKMGDYAAQSGPRSSFNFSKKMRAKLWFLVVTGSGSFSNSSIHYIFPTVTGYNAGQPSHKSFGFTVSGTTIKGFAHNGTNYNTTTNSVAYTNQYTYLGVVENDGAGVYSFWVNNNGTFTSLGTVSGPTGLVTQEFLFGANASSTTTNDVNGYYTIQTVDFASEP